MLECANQQKYACTQDQNADSAPWHQNAVATLIYKNELHNMLNNIKNDE